MIRHAGRATIDLEQVHVTTWLQHAVHFHEHTRRVPQRLQRERGDDAVKGPVRTGNPCSIPGAELEFPRHATKLGGPSDQRRRRVQTAGIGPQRATPCFFDDPPVSAADEQQALPCLDPDNVEDEQIEVAPGLSLRLGDGQWLAHAPPGCNTCARSVAPHAGHRPVST